MRREPDNTRADAPACRISYWQGYVTGRYFAYEGDLSRVVLYSAAFRTWTWRQGNVMPPAGEAAEAALADVLRELAARGWRVAAFDLDGYVSPAAMAAAEPRMPVFRKTDAMRETEMSDDTLLVALNRIGGASGATAAEIGREALGTRTPLVQHLPQRVGAKLRRLERQGKVERLKNDGTAKWVRPADDRSA